jgi:FkbM family methyltransferase
VNIENASVEWGTYAPRGATKRILTICSALPNNHWIFYSLTKALRTFIKRSPARFYDVEAHGLRLRLLNHGNYSDTKLLFSPQFYDQEELNWLCEQLGQGGTFLDVGGNIGGYSLVVAKRLGPKVSVHTVEPDADLCQRILFNVQQNGLRVRLHATALSDYEGAGHLNRSEKQSGENALTSTASNMSVGVPVTTLLKLCNAAGIDGIRALKIDIEGHEYPVLKKFFEDADRTLWPRAMVIEHTHEKGNLSNLLQRMEYEVVRRTKRNLLLVR